MYKTRVLIISERKEQSIKYKKLIEVQKQDVIITNNLSDTLGIIQKKEIEFIIISDTIKEKLSEFIKKIRVLTFNSRPIIIAVSKSGDLEDKLEVLEAGADDFLGEEISKQEFQMRFMAHLRRYLESSLNQITHLPDKNITIKAIRKSLEAQADISYLLLRVNNLDIYRKTHGEIAYEKVLQTLGAIINSTLSQSDYAGHILDDELILITGTIQAEKIVSFLAFAFDNILNKFYCADEFENNFTIKAGDNIEETKSGLMRLNIAVKEKGRQNSDERELINSLFELINLCRAENYSSYIIDRAKLKGEVLKKEKNKVLIFEPDGALSYLLESVCELNDIKAKIAALDNFFELYENFKPDVVLLDWGTEGESIEIAKKISKDNIKLIFSSSYLDKKEILKAGADLYIPKPYEIDDIIFWIKKFLA